MSKAYADLKTLFESKECKLLTTEEEISTSNKLSHTKVSFVAKCGHHNDVFVTNFKQKSSGVLCKECIKGVVSKKLKDHHTEKEEASKCTIQECQLIDKLQVFMQDNLQCIKTNEGCMSDMIIKPMNVEEDEWLRIQVKTTLDVSHNLYSFKLHGNFYENNIILCCCISHNRYWLIPHECVSQLKKSLNIGLTSKSIYHKYEVAEHLLHVKLIEYYQEIPLYSYDDCMIPRSVYQQRELIFQQKRIERFPFLTFDKPKYNQSYYDFRVNGKNIQEKLACKRHDRAYSYIVCLYRSSNRQTMSCKRSFQPYKLGMNAFYWINLPDTTIFYLFPEGILYEKRYIEGKEQLPTAKPILNINLSYEEGWYQNCRYDYENINEVVFNAMFDID